MLELALYPFQNDAVDRALERGSLLIAFEMGLGKTVISIAIIEELLGLGEIETAVIVVPASLKLQWAQAIARATDVDTREVQVRGSDGVKQAMHLPTEDYCVVVGAKKETAAGRRKQYKTIEERRPEYVIVGYENVVNDWKHIRRINPGCIVLDEATAIKTFSAQRTKKIKRFVAPYRFALSGQPVENRPEELFSIMQWVDEEVLGRFDVFDPSFIVRNHFGGVQRYKNLDLLHRKLAQAMVRKTRHDEDVAPYLPDVEETNLVVSMDPAGRRLYKRIVGDLQAELTRADFAGGFDLYSHYHDGSQNAAQGKIMSRYGALVQLCDHPDLLVESAMNYERSQVAIDAGEVKQMWPGSRYAYQLWIAGALEDVRSSPKLDAVVDKVSTILDTHRDNKVIIFSTYKTMLAILDHELGSYGAVQHHGDMSSAEKTAAQVKFRTDPSCRVFLSSDAGTYGVDLPEANYLIDYDQTASAGRKGQRDARHVRAGSEHETVYVINALVAGSVEVRQQRVVRFKADIGSAIMDGAELSIPGELQSTVPSLSQWLDDYSV